MGSRKASGVLSSRAGFTLIELLVVIAIISLLLAILIPSLYRSRARGVLTTCVSNLRQQGAALLEYTQEHSDRLPPRLVTTTRADRPTGHQLINQVLSKFRGETFGPVGARGFATPVNYWRCPEIGVNNDIERATHFGILHQAPNRWLFNTIEHEVVRDMIRASYSVHRGWECTRGVSGWRRLDLINDTSDVVSLMDNVNTYVPEHRHRDARESIGYSIETAYDDGDRSLDDNIGSHRILARRPTVFVDGHATALPSMKNYWLDLRNMYHPDESPEAHCSEFWQREVRAFLWFIGPNDLGPPTSSLLPD